MRREEEYQGGRLEKAMSEFKRRNERRKEGKGVIVKERNK